jgi:hypothetical protein
LVSMTGIKKTKLENRNSTPEHHNKKFRGRPGSLTATTTPYPLLTKEGNLAPLLSEEGLGVVVS